MRNRFGIDLDFRVETGPDELYRVIYQVGENVLQQSAMGSHRLERAGHCDCLPHVREPDNGNLLDYRFDVDVAQHNLLARDSAELQQIVSKRLHSPAGTRDSFDQPARVGGAARGKRVQYYSTKTADPSRRRAQVVRDGVTKRFQFRDRFLQPRGAFLYFVFQKLRVLAQRVRGLLQLPIGAFAGQGHREILRDGSEQRGLFFRDTIPAARRKTQQT